MCPFTGNSGKFTWISVFALGLHVSIVTAKIIKYSYFVRCTGLCVLVSAVVHCPSSIVFNKQRLPTNWLYCTWKFDFSGEWCLYNHINVIVSFCSKCIVIFTFPVCQKDTIFFLFMGINLYETPDSIFVIICLVSWEKNKTLERWSMVTGIHRTSLTKTSTFVLIVTKQCLDVLTFPQDK